MRIFNQILSAITAANKKLDALMTQQNDLTADVQAIQEAVTGLGAASAAIEAEIESLQEANPQLDLTSLDSAVGTLTTAVSAVTAIAPPAAAPAPPPAAS
jgi:uncharacterized protein YlxW (UPF0749 family)